jgi:hypothetical protein
MSSTGGDTSHSNGTSSSRKYNDSVIASAMMSATAGMPALRMYTRFSDNQKFVCDGEKKVFKK